MNEEITTEEKYYKNGNLWSRINYKNRKLYGVLEGYYENGNLFSRINYKDGKFHGLCEYWYENGTLYSRKYYFNDEEVTEFEFDVLEASEEPENE